MFWHDLYCAFVDCGCTMWPSFLSCYISCMIWPDVDINWKLSSAGRHMGRVIFSLWQTMCRQCLLICSWLGTLYSIVVTPFFVNASGQISWWRSSKKVVSGTTKWPCKLLRCRFDVVQQIDHKLFLTLQSTVSYSGVIFFCDVGHPCGPPSAGSRCWRLSVSTGKAPLAWLCTYLMLRPNSFCATLRALRCWWAVAMLATTSSTKRDSSTQSTCCETWPCSRSPHPTCFCQTSTSCPCTASMSTSGKTRVRNKMQNINWQCYCQLNALLLLSQDTRQFSILSLWNISHIHTVTICSLI